MRDDERTDPSEYGPQFRLSLEVIVCGLPGCLEVWEPSSQRGRPRRYCSAAHRQAAYDERKRLERSMVRRRPQHGLVV